MTSWRERARSFGYAIAGVRTLVAEQPHARFHLLAGVLVIALAALLNVSRVEWIALLFAIALVWLAEGMNTALEYVCDATVPEQHPLIGKAKDVAAGAVLICAGIAVIVGLLVFTPYLF